MKKTIQVIIKQKDSFLGPINTTKSLALGYVFNYLIPNNIVEIASEGKIKHINMLKNIKSKQAKINYNINLEMKTNLEKIQKINIRKKLGQNQQIFGRITENEVIEQIIKLTGKRLDKKQIKLPNIKEIGIYDIVIRIQENINTIVKLQILPSIL
uniref:ribosomal protein L9 n=1 Tax=Lithothamnion corallioides TaxID=1277934 RepID=UPI0023F16850|nr:ribosomal protein L9 [Lithothamnion corallioides]WEA77072.1 ribosomal protein L9 [Lithothamnion corallioides]